MKSMVFMDTFMGYLPFLMFSYDTKTLVSVVGLFSDAQSVYTVQWVDSMGLINILHELRLHPVHDRPTTQRSMHRNSLFSKLKWSGFLEGRKLEKHCRLRTLRKQNELVGY